MTHKIHIRLHCQSVKDNLVWWVDSWPFPECYTTGQRCSSAKEALRFAWRYC